MVGLVPTIHVFASLIAYDGQDVDARHKGEHDGVSWDGLEGIAALEAGCSE
jgi:hypothetical protein